VIYGGIFNDPQGMERQLTAITLMATNNNIKVRESEKYKKQKNGEYVQTKATHSSVVRES